MKPITRRCFGIFILLVFAVSTVRAEIPDSLRLDHILSIAGTDPDRALALLEESVARGVSRPGEASEARAVAYEAKGEFQTALAYARIALSEQSSKDDVELYRGNCERVISLLMRLGDYKEALRFCRVLRLKLAKENAPEKDGASLARLEAVAYREFGRKSLADSLMTVSTRLLSLDEGGHGPGGLAENYRILSAWAEEDGDYPSALEYAELWLRELSGGAASCGGRCDLVLANLDAAVMAAEAGDRSRAAAYYAAARSGSMNMSARGSSPWDDPECQLLDARYNLLAGDEEYSMNMLTRLAATAPDSGLRLRALRLLTVVKASRKDYRGALALSEKAGGLADSLFSAWKLDNALQLSAFYKERELRGELMGQKAEIRFQRSVIISAFILVAMLSALVALALISNKVVKRKNLALAKLIEDYREARDSAGSLAGSVADSVVGSVVGSVADSAFGAAEDPGMVPASGPAAGQIVGSSSGSPVSEMPGESGGSVVAPDSSRTCRSTVKESAGESNVGAVGHDSARTCRPDVNESTGESGGSVVAPDSSRTCRSTVKEPMGESNWGAVDHDSARTCRPDVNEPIGESDVEAGGTEVDGSDYLALRDLILRERLFLDAELTRDNVARLSGMNRNRLARVIQEYSGTNFSGFINLMRLDHSLTLLEKSDATIEAVALDSGFGNVRTYHRLFKDRFGMTPSEYREASAHLRRNSRKPSPDESE